MNTTKLKANWNEQKGKLKQKFAILTHNNLLFAQGKNEEMFGRLQKKLVQTKSDFRKTIGIL